MLGRSSGTNLNGALLVLVVVIFLAARVWRLTASCLWFDEIFSVHAAEHSWGTLLHFVAADLVHPPLFYLLLKVWIGIGGESLLWLRLFPVLTSAAAIAPFILLLRKLNLPAAGTSLALLLLAVNGYLIRYAQEVRMYSLLFLLSVCSLWMFVSLITEANSFRHVAALTVVNLLLVYSHYYGWLLIAVQALALFIVKRSQLKAFLIGCALLVIGYVLWVFEIARGHAASGQVAQNIGWIPRPRIQQVAELWVLMNQPFLFERSNAENEGNALTISLMLIVFAVPLAVLCWRLRKRDQDLGITRRLLSILLILAFGPPILVGLLSWILPYSVWGTRHLIIAMPVYGAIVALGLTSLRPYWAKVGLSLIFGCWLLVAGFYSVIKPAPVLIWCCWEQLAERMIQIESRSPQTVSVYAFEDLVGYHLWFALKRSAGTNFKVNVIKNFPGANEDPAYFLPRNFDEISAQQSAVPVSDEIWIAFRASAWDQNRQPLSSFVQAGYQNGRVLMLEAQGETAFLVQLLRK